MDVFKVLHMVGGMYGIPVPDSAGKSDWISRMWLFHSILFHSKVKGLIAMALVSRGVEVMH